MVVKTEIEREMVVCYPPDDVPMIEDPKNPGKFKPDVTWLITEDETPVDNQFSEKEMRLLTEPLYSSWRDSKGGNKPFAAMANVGFFYSPSEPPLVPDMLLSVNVSIPANIHLKENRSYFLWEYNKVPEVVIEIVSNRKGREDTAKLAIYARIGVPWYIIHDPNRRLSKQLLRIYRLDGKVYRQVDDTFFPEVGLGLIDWEGEYEGCTDDWIRWRYQDGTLVPTGQERADLQTKRADQEKQIAKKERGTAQRERETAQKEREIAQREREIAEKEKQRADQLAALLRSHGIVPPTPSS